MFENSRKLDFDENGVWVRQPLTKPWHVEWKHVTALRWRVNYLRLELSTATEHGAIRAYAGSLDLDHFALMAQTCIAPDVLERASATTQLILNMTILGRGTELAWGQPPHVRKQ